MFFKYFVIGIYALVIAYAGLRGVNKVKSFGDFFLGGGKVGGFLSAFTYATTYFSAVLFIGFAGKIGWLFGMSGLWIALGNTLVGVLLVWLVMGRKIKEMSMEYNVYTMPEFLEKRYKSKELKFISAFIIFVFMIPYSAAVFIGLSYLFQTNFNLPYSTALIVMGVFTAFYMVLGGYGAMAFIDMFFGLIMVAGVLTLFGFTLKLGDGFSGIFASLHGIDPELISIAGPPGWWKLFCIVFLTSIAPFAMPQLIQKFYAIKDFKEIKKGAAASSVFALLISGIAYFTGACAKLFLNPETNPLAFNNGKPVFDAIMPELLANVIPGSLSVIMLLLVLSASMSTLAALVLISSSSLVRDFYVGFINKDCKDSRQTLLMRIISIFFILISVILAYKRPATIVAILGISWGAIGSFFLGPFIWGLFTKKTTKIGALIGGIVGLTTCISMYVSGVSSPEAGTIGMLVSISFPPVSDYIYNIYYKSLKS